MTMTTQAAARLISDDDLLRPPLITRYTCFREKHLQVVVIIIIAVRLTGSIRKNSGVNAGLDSF